MLTRGIGMDNEAAYRVGTRVRVREQRGCTATYGVGAEGGDYPP
jgi:hypothetical protein